VDGFDDDESEGESDEGGETGLGFLASERDAFEALELPEGLLDAGSGAIEGLGEEGGPIPGIGFVGDDRRDAATAGSGAVTPAGVALVRDGGAWPHVGPEIEQRLEDGAIPRLAAGQMEGERQAVKVGLEVDFRREAAPRASERLGLLPPFAPAAETWARTTVESNICTKSAVALTAASASKKASMVPLSRRRQNRFQIEFQLPTCRSGA
jgi:hypothetical protein